MEFVWIDSEKCWGNILEKHALYSKVSYFKNGMFIEEIFESDELIDLQEMGINYESE